jgi:hypothetical protein
VQGGRHKGVALVGREVGQRQTTGVRQGQPGLGGERIGPVQEQQQTGQLGQGGSDALKRGEARVVGPLNIVENEEQGHAGGTGGQQGSHQLV